MKKFTLLLFSFICLSGLLSAQITFQKTYGGTNDETANSVKQTNDGGYIITGSTKSYGGSDLYLVKTSVDGTLQWTKTYSASSINEGFSVQQTNDGGFIVTGLTGFDVPNSSPNYSLYLLKTASDGNLLWSKTYGGGLGYAVQQVGDGGFIVCGAGGSSGVYLLKTGSDGSLQWANSIGGQYTEQGYSFKQTSDGGFIIAGTTLSFKNDNSSDVYLVKTGSDGSLQWAKTYGGAGSHEGYSVEQASDGGFIAVGYTYYGTGIGVYVLKTDINGSLQWAKRFGGTNVNFARAIEATNDGGFVIIGHTNSFGSDIDAKVYCIKIGSDGSLQWSKTFGGTAGDTGYSIQQTSDGGFIIVGITNSFGAGGFDVYLIKTDSNGNSGCNETNPNTIVSTGASQTGVGGIEISGGIENNVITQTGSGGTTITICSTVGLEEITQHDFIDIYPNPSSGIFTVILQNCQAGARVTVRDVLGNCLLEKDCRGETSQEINLSCQPRGIYFVELLSGDERVVKKVAVQ